MKAGDLVLYDPHGSGFVAPRILKNTIGVVLAEKPYEFHGIYLSVFMVGRPYLVPQDNLRKIEDKE